jgi:predicted amidohydrolase YtcJ
MNTNIIGLRAARVYVACAALALTYSSSSLAADAADLILTGGQVYTPAGWQEALAVRNGAIVAVGTAKDIATHKGPTTTIVALAGRAVFPGLHDMHVHSLFAGMEQFQCRFPYGATPPVIADAVRACAAHAQPGEWIVGGNWVGAVFENSKQDKQFLDAVAPNNPVLLNDEAHHSVWVNSRALAAAGVTRTTQNPAGGIIERDASGEPTGLFRETATNLVEDVVPQPSAAAKRKALILSTNQMLSYGITAYTDATVRADNMSTLSTLSRDGLLKQHVRGCIVWAPGNKEGETLIAERSSYSTPRYEADCVKIFMDGVPTESHTAAMLAPYQDDRHAQGEGAANKGILMIPQPVLDAAVTNFDRQGLHIKFHAVGDAAVRSVFEAIASARKANGWGGPMHDVGHNTFVDPSDIPRVRELHMAWEFSPYIWYPTPIVDDIRRAVGDERMQRFIPIKDGVASGATVVAGSDWSVVPSVNPWLAIETMVTRQRPGGGNDDAIAAGQRIQLDQALRIFTTNAAEVMGRRSEVGSIETGMRADLIVTETNPFRTPITQVHATKVSLTFIDGEKVFDAASPPLLTAR